MLDEAMRIQAAREIAQLGETQTAVKYLAWLCNGYAVGGSNFRRVVEPADRMAAVREIAQLVDATTAAQALADLIGDRLEEYRAAKVREFTQLVEAAAATQALVALLEDHSIDEKTRAEAVRAIVQIGDNALAVSTLTALAGNAAVADEHRLQAAREIAKLGNTTAAVNAYTALVENSEAESSDRLQAAEEIAKLGRISLAVYAYSIVAKDEWAEIEHRIEAAQELLKLGDTLEGVNAVNAVLAVTNYIDLDMGFTDASYRWNSAMTIAEKGDIDTATDILMKIVNNDNPDSLGPGYENDERFGAAEGIAKIGNTAAAIEAFAILFDDFDIEVWQIEELDDKRIAAYLLIEKVEQWFPRGDPEAYQALLKLVMSLEPEDEPAPYFDVRFGVRGLRRPQLVISLDPDPYFDKTATPAW